ncbi:hypothetical protein FACS1894167_01630 [Synergistales bacterium]|nr:hypothetical protein FACS1894167_01630 [Synergistales bacterium]
MDGSTLYNISTNEITRAAGIRGIEGKNSKDKRMHSQRDIDWNEIWLENLRKFGVSPAETAKPDETNSVFMNDGTDMAVNREVDSDRAPVKHSAADFDEMVAIIRGMILEPEKLLESHLGVFIEPAPPGKVLNAQG